MHTTLIQDDAGGPKGGPQHRERTLRRKKKLEDQFSGPQRLESIACWQQYRARSEQCVDRFSWALHADARAKEPGDVKLLATMEKKRKSAGLAWCANLSFATGSAAPRPVQVKHLLRDITGIIKKAFPIHYARDYIPNDLQPIPAKPDANPPGPA